MRRHNTPRRTKLFVASLLALSLTALFFHRTITAPLVSLVQVVVPFQDAAGRVVDAAGNVLPDDGRGLSRAESDQLAREREALRHQLAALSLRVGELERENHVLTAIRLHEVDGQRIGARGRLIPARAITGDINPWRSSRLIDSGTLRGVKSGAAVASMHFGIDAGTEEGIAEGMAILLSEVLVGTIESAGTHTARARLLSDPGSRIKVRTGRFIESGYNAGALEFWLEGRGRGGMEIRDIDMRDVEHGAVQPGDMVLVNADSGLVPAAMTVGTIAEIATDVHNPLLGIAKVTSPLDEGDLRRVYVYDPGGE